MNGFKRDIKPKEDMNMKKNTETAKIPMINQVLKDAALGHLAECGLPQSLIHRMASGHGITRRKALLQP